MLTIPLTRGHVALVDDADWEWLSQWRWWAQEDERTVYAVRRELDPITRRRRMIRMHRVILDAPSGVQVDHEDCDGLNNQRHNLRLATQSQNKANLRRPRNNTSGVKGVSWSQGRQRWRALIRVDRKLRHLGYFDSIEDAAAAYWDAAQRYFRSFARAA